MPQVRTIGPVPTGGYFKSTGSGLCLYQTDYSALAIALELNLDETDDLWPGRYAPSPSGQPYPMHCPLYSER